VSLFELDELIRRQIESLALAADLFEDDRFAYPCLGQTQHILHSHPRKRDCGHQK
jgi:hypothetical protein